VGYWRRAILHACVRNSYCAVLLCCVACGTPSVPAFLLPRVPVGPVGLPTVVAAPEPLFTSVLDWLDAPAALTMLPRLLRRTD